MRAEDILIDIDDDFPGLEFLLEFGTRRHSMRPRFPPHQVGAKGSSFCSSAEGRGMLRFLLSHLDSDYMHVLIRSF